MAMLLLLLLMVAKISGSDAAWCICRSDASSNTLQKALDYACGAGADCTVILQNGACYQPNTVLAHCSYAVNSYYQRKAQAPDACDFSNTATLSNTDPSANGCTYPPNPIAAGTSSSTPTQTSGTIPSGTSPPASGTPSTTFSPPATGTPSTTFSPPATGTPTTFIPPASGTPSIFSPPSGGTGTSTGAGGVLGGLGPSGTTTSSSMDSSAGGLALKRAGGLMSYPLMTILIPALATFAADKLM